MAGSLDEIGLKHQTDKSSLTHNYLNFYELFFEPLRTTDIKILEIGVYHGASLKTWEEYFSKANIIGVDINTETKKYESNRTTIEIANQSNIEDLTKLSMLHGPFDIIIEDGSHMWEHQITSLRTLFPFLKPGGYYIVEDLHTNYGANKQKYKGVSSISCVEYLKRWLDSLVGYGQVNLNDIEDAFLRTYGRSAKFLIFHRHACLIKKMALVALPIVFLC